MCGVNLSLMTYYVLFFLMIRRPPRSTRTDTLLPYTTLFRSHVGGQDRLARSQSPCMQVVHSVDIGLRQHLCPYVLHVQTCGNALHEHLAGFAKQRPRPRQDPQADQRSEERRVGKEWVSTWRSRWSVEH